MRRAPRPGRARPARLRRRPKISRSSERRNRVDRPRPRVAAGRRPVTPPTPQPLTSKPSPVSETNRSSRLGRRAPRSPCTATPGVHERGDDLLRRRRRRACRCAVAGPPCAPAPGPSSRSTTAAASAGWSVSDPARGGAARRAARRAVPWATSRPTCMTPTWVQICSTSDSRWLETQHRGARRRRATRQVSAPRGCPAGRGRWSARRGRAGRGAQQRGGDGEPLPHARASRRGSACPRRPAARPGRARRRCACLAVRGSAVRSAASSRRRLAAAGQVGVEGRTLDQRADPGQHPAGTLPASAAPSSCGVPAVGLTRPSSIRIVVVLPEPFGPEEAVDRPRAARPGRCASTATCRPNRLVSPRVATARPRPVTSRQLRRPGQRRPCRAAPGATAPTATRPSSVSSAENSVPLSSVPAAPGAATPSAAP